MNAHAGAAQERPISFQLNGRAVNCVASDRMTLGDLLRHGLGRTGTHYGCEQGVCGACTVLVDGRAVRSCLQLAAQADGRTITTVEGLTQPDGSLGHLQEAFRECHALQCGFCTPGFLTTLTEFLKDHPQPSADEVRERISGNLCRCTGYQPIVDAVLLAARNIQQAKGAAIADGAAAPTSNHESGKFVGQEVRRSEDFALVRGEGRFVDDIDLPGTLHCAFVRSPYAHARIRSIDRSAALAAPGVHAVWANEDLPAELRGPLPYNTPPVMIDHPRLWSILAQREVCYVGEAVAVVIAQSRHLAEDACALVDVDYEPLEVCADYRDALREGAPRTHSDIPSNLVARLSFATGDIEAAFRDAAHVVKRTIHHHRGTGHPIECRVTLASFDIATGDLTVWNAGQAPYMERRALAQALRHDEGRLRVIMPDVGGAFGPKGMPYPEEFLVAAAARQLRQPVKWTEDRREHFLCLTQERDQLWEMELALNAQGRILGLRGHVLHDNGAYVPWGLVVPVIAVTSSLGPYVVPAVKLDLEVAYTNKVPTTPLRGAGRPKATFVIERLMDAAADALGLSRLEIRERNFVQPEQMPYATGLIFRDGSPMVYDSGDYPRTQRSTVELADLPDFRVRQEAARRAGRYIGIGFANFVEGCGVGPYEGAEVTLRHDGRFYLNVGGAASQGQGMKTVFAQIAAEQLGVPMEAITVTIGDTQKLAMGVGTFASRITVNAGNAVHVACQMLARKLRTVAGVLMKADPGDVHLQEGGAVSRADPGKTCGLAEIARASYGIPGFNLPKGMEPGMTVTHYFSPAASVYSNGAAFAEVEVDIETGDVKVRRYGVSHDCGTLINPLLVRGQVLGGILHGIGNTLLEHHAYDAQAQPLSTNLAEFALPGSLDMPPLVQLHHTETPSPNNPLGVKGAGEGGTIPASAAIVSAIEDALSQWDVRFDESPVLPEQVFRALQAAGAYERAATGAAR
jgi:carbon-monoxide dehydrogenase large subunit